ncbi:hypothetical protein [Limnoraphis robusta]|uniref:Uncharacterized protein n=1 Tax=Limnoraphis robusta CCNP1315 TaxID=3110306 RepID=A0ABU5U866_9CYAN|nr:hypothetical protein [Limnoraphis robusta]MEA5522813.1 hypothetical protein [Limnoraphis robusta CCNP1315]MEA5549005.1 hypothetical protein [Limnoraphis robusta CCNP1324]
MSGVSWWFFKILDFIEVQPHLTLSGYIFEHLLNPLHLGGVGSDTFILGDETGKFYTAAGDQDFAVITDLDFTQDVIQLRGSYFNYV